MLYRYMPLPRRQAPYSGNSFVYAPIMIESYFPPGCGLHRFLIKYHIFGFHQLFEHSDQNISDWLEISRDLHFYKGFPKEFDPHILIFLNIFGFFSSFLKILNRNISESSFPHTFYIGNLIGFIRNIQQWNS